MAFWATFYRNLYELPSDERPPDEVLGDDERLDRWWENKLREYDRELRKAKAGRR